MSTHETFMVEAHVEGQPDDRWFVMSKRHFPTLDEARRQAAFINRKNWHSVRIFRCWGGVRQGIVEEL